MAVELITKEDLNSFKAEVISEIRQILNTKGVIPDHKEWLKSFEVKKLLRISSGTLQQMRVKGTIAYTRIGGLMFYKYADIMKLMEVHTSQNKSIASQMNARR